MLLDANVLLALAWPHHVHHGLAKQWFEPHAKHGWASCALTQSAFVRILSQPAFAARTGQLSPSLASVAQMLHHYTSHPGHRLLNMDFGFDEVVHRCTGGIQGHRQITDAYLLTLAMRNGIGLLTLDAGLGQLLASPAQRKQHVCCLV